MTDRPTPQSRIATIERQPVPVTDLGPERSWTTVALIAMLAVAVGGTGLAVVLATLRPDSLGATPPNPAVVVEDGAAAAP